MCVWIVDAAGFGRNRVNRSDRPDRGVRAHVIYVDGLRALAGASAHMPMEDGLPRPGHTGAHGVVHHKEECASDGAALDSN